MLSKLSLILWKILHAIQTRDSEFFNRNKSQWFGFIDDIKNNFQFKEISLKEQCRNKSWATYWAATEANKQEERGTWEIGYDHCNDIKKFKDSPDYYLTTREEFNLDFNAYTSLTASSTSIPTRSNPPMPNRPLPPRPISTDKKTHSLNKSTNKAKK